MAGQVQKRSKKEAPRYASKPQQKPTARSGSKAYKKGKLSKDARFSSRKIKWTPIIVIICVLLAFLSAIILGNYLGEMAEDSGNTTASTDGTANITPPSADKVAPHKNLQAYFADMTGADPEKSLSELTSGARERGNALLVNIKNDSGKIIYSSDKTSELGFEHRDNLTLSRLGNHFEYYNDFAVGFFSSDFSADLDTEKALKLQTNEIILLKEATDIAFKQIIVDFSGSITKENLLHYQSYLLSLKLACPKTPVGIMISAEFLGNPDNAGAVAGLLDTVDFFVLNLEGKSADSIKATLSPLVYFTERYNCVILLSDAEETALAESILTIKDKGIDNYIVK